VAYFFDVTVTQSHWIVEKVILNFTKLKDRFLIRCTLYATSWLSICILKSISIFVFYIMCYYFVPEIWPRRKESIIYTVSVIDILE